MEAVASPRRNLFDQLAYGLDRFCCEQIKKLAPEDDPMERLQVLRQVRAELEDSGALQNDALMFPDIGNVANEERSQSAVAGGMAFFPRRECGIL